MIFNKDAYLKMVLIGDDAESFRQFPLQSSKMKQ